MIMISNKKDTNNFSVGLGLFDYINPIFYTITSLTIHNGLDCYMNKSLFNLYTVGIIISIIFGFMIPTVKFIVGLGIMKFKMPVNLVALVNTGIFLSGVALFCGVFKLNNYALAVIFVVTLVLLGMLVYKTKKLNTAAVLIGAVGYLLIYSSLIVISKQTGMLLPIIMYVLAILDFVFLCLVGIKSDLKNSRVHWAIEIGNVICQGLVALATVILL